MRIADGEDFLMRVVEIVQQIIDVGADAEPVFAQRHLDLPGLIGVARLRTPLDGDKFGVGTGRLLESAATLLESVEGRVHPRYVE